VIVISRDLVLSPLAAERLNLPVIGWHNMVTISNATASSTAIGYPISNVANPSTQLKWRAASTAAQTVELGVAATDDIDYVGIAGHNFGSAGIALAIDRNGASPAWDEIVEEFMPATDDAIIARFTPGAYSRLRLRLASGSAAAQVAVIYVGKLLVCERGLPGDHTPVNLGRSSKVTNNRSEAGHFLGRVQTGRQAGSQASFRHLTSGWYRTYFDPFLKVAETEPFFFAWKPQEFPGDVGYCWLTNDPQPTRDFTTGRMHVDLNLGAALI
jgi:hypothetical protein